MKRRLDLAMTLIGDPRIIFLDEPTAGLDPRSRRVMWQIVRELVAGGVTIFLTTQYLDEADRLAHRIAVLDQGRLVAAGDAGRAQAPGPGRPHPAVVRRRSRARAGRRGLRRCVARRRGADPAGPERRRGRARCGRSSTGSTPARSTSAGSSVQTPDLDDVFLSLTGDDRDATRRRRVR